MAKTHIDYDLKNALLKSTDHWDDEKEHIWLGMGAIVTDAEDQFFLLGELAGGDFLAFFDPKWSSRTLRDKIIAEVKKELSKNK